MNCWFCYEFVTDYILLPEKNDVFEIPKNKNAERTFTKLLAFRKLRRANCPSTIYTMM